MKLIFDVTMNTVVAIDVEDVSKLTIDMEHLDRASDQFRDAFRDLLKEEFDECYTLDILKFGMHVEDL